jgi:predicted transcriptional regulator with HTH domain
MLVLADRGFFSYDLWRSYLLTGAALLWRLSKTTHLPVLQVLPDGSYLSEIKSFKGPGKTRIHIDQIADPMLATHITVRVIEYQVDTGDGTTDTFRLITTILDPDQADALTLASAYTQRWEFESSLREIECQLLEPGSTLRSKRPETVRQEIWGLLLAHYAIRAFMAEAADTVDLDPDRLSTIRAINIVRRFVTDPAAFSPRRATAAADPSDQ